ncbi:hypothetical protein PF005_g30629 [Phytophthora fragariae]|uniref:BED-type domain-containing protein n=2 Tax=Phytophthora fragariae TaxID=53985 RepID=A0A6A3GVY9_9STRA|nr:hypothetical protein PF011_g29807 [Phytophthora fragariae]KAE9162987.1 hypothetical protein PF005_g30629 [Phytophthora fragariae]KAE9164144.1 hypothetical protein PF004_g29922 [Phytophthora fragariae]
MRVLAPNPAPRPFSNKQVARFFFSPALDEQGESTGYQVCKSCGKHRKRTPRSGYTNLVSHVRDSHPNYEGAMRDASAAATGTLVPWVSQKATNRFGWMRWIVMCNLPFAFCESEETRRFTNLPPICVETLYGDMESVVKAVEKDIGEEMPMAFGLIIDGWTHGTEHFLAVYACYESLDGPRFPLLSMAPIIDEPDDALNADGHAAAIARFLPFFGRSLADVLFLVGDN